MTADARGLMSRVAPPPAYRPGGGVAFAAFALLAAAGAATALGAAYLLRLAEADLYYYFITPFIISAPVFGMLWVAVHLGRCRNPLIAAALGAGLMAVYYVGYWQFSYRHNVVQHGRGMVMLVEAISGVR